MQRTVKFLKHLPALGYESVVITGPEGASVAWAPADRTIERDVPKSTRVARIPSAPPETGGVARRLRRVLGRPTPFERWWRDGATALGRAHVTDVDLVFASMSPFVTAVAARDIAHAGRVPWIADLRDPWALDEWTIYPTALHRRIERRRMRLALGSAEAVIMNTPEAARALRSAFPELESTRVATIPNGWDREDFGDELSARQDGRLRIVYTGYVHLHAGEQHRSRRRYRELLGASTPGLDVLARSDAYLNRALVRLRELDPELARRIELHIAGPATSLGLSREQGVHVRHHGYLPHDEAVALMQSADVLFLPMHDVPAGVRVRTVPGKTYEYLASGRSIVAALPDGDARDLLSGIPGVWLCRPTNVECIAAALREALRAAPEQRAPTEILERFERSRLAGELARLFDEVLEVHRPARPMT